MWFIRIQVAEDALGFRSANYWSGAQVEDRLPSKISREQSRLNIRNEDRKLTDAGNVVFVEKRKKELK